MDFSKDFILRLLLFLFAKGAIFNARNDFYLSSLRPLLHRF